MIDEYLPLSGRNPKSRRLDKKKSTIPEGERKEYYLGEREMWEI